MVKEESESRREWEDFWERGFIEIRRSACLLQTDKSGAEKELRTPFIYFERFLFNQLNQINQ